MVGGYAIGARRTETKLGLIARALVWTAVIMVITTAVFDNVIIALGIVGYDENKISGLLLGLAPIEDFSYTVVSVLAVGILWHKLTKANK